MIQWSSGREHILELRAFNFRQKVGSQLELHSEVSQPHDREIMINPKWIVNFHNQLLW